MAEKSVIKMNGSVTEALGGDKFRVTLDNGMTVTAYPCGRLRVKRIRVMPGDGVTVELSPYDLTNGRITRRQ